MTNHKVVPLEISEAGVNWEQSYLKELLSNSNINDGVTIALETERLANKHGDFLCCDDLKEILRVGISNVQELMRSKPSQQSRLEIELWCLPYPS